MATAHFLDATFSISVPAAAATLAGFREWAKSDEFPERGSISFIDSRIIIDMSPEEIETHNKVKMAVGGRILALGTQRKLGTLYGDGTLLTCRVAGLSTEPDSLFATWETLRSGRLKRIARKKRPHEYIELSGTPDWVLEVISESSVQKDSVLLLKAYHAAKIPEYWMIDARGPQIRFRILVYAPAGYQEVAAQNGWYRSPVFGCCFRLVRRRDPLGDWQYTLQVKSG